MQLPLYPLIRFYFRSTGTRNLKSIDCRMPEANFSSWNWTYLLWVSTDATAPRRFKRRISSFEPPCESIKSVRSKWSGTEQHLLVPNNTTQSV